MKPAVRACLAVCAVAWAFPACEGGKTERGGAPRLGGDPEKGEALIESSGCGACHSIPGVRSARGELGPPLGAFARRSFIAGELPNTPDNLVRWITNPVAVHPRTAMPALGLGAQDARDVAAYLYTLD